MHSIIVVHTEFKLSAKSIIELLVFLSFILQQALQLAFHFILNVLSDQGQLTVMLQHLSGDVQGKIL
ncbi:hypothetical protein D3C79_1116600 [compost metagenome]